MAYNTILVHVDHSAHAAQRIRIAAELAHRAGAHLVGAATTLPPLGQNDYGFDMGAMMLMAATQPAMPDPQEALASFDVLAASVGLSSCERCLLDDDAQTALAERARYSDLVVMSQADPAEVAAGTVSGPALPEGVLMHSTRPVLFIPYAGHFPRVGQRVLVAWDGSAEASRAVSGALPLLRTAREVVVALFNPAPGQQDGADIALYLARHGVPVDVQVQHVDIDIGNALLSLAAELDVDLIVMGGYSHSRVREAVLGGTTRTVLATMTVPVLMAH
ncbi:MAG: universal stress protein [Pseudomonadota bacterium]